MTTRWGARGCRARGRAVAFAGALLAAHLGCGGDESTAEPTGTATTLIDSPNPCVGPCNEGDCCQWVSGEVGFVEYACEDGSWVMLDAPSCSATETSGDTTSDDGGTSGGTSGGTTDTGGELGDCVELGAWNTSAPFGGGVSHPFPSFAVGPFFYVHTMDGEARVLWSATPNSDGSLGAWQNAGDHGGGPQGFTAIDVGGTAFHFRNGHIAEYPFDASGHLVGDVILHEASVDTSFGGEKFFWDSAVYAPFGSGPQWVFHLGGFSMTPYAYRSMIHRSAVPLGASFEATGVEHPAERPGKAAFFGPPNLDRGYIYTGESGGAALWRIEVGADGSVGTIEPQADLPAGTDNERGDLFAVGSNLFSIRGASVFRASLAVDGTMGGFVPMSGLPQPQIAIGWGDGHLEGATAGVIGDNVYVTGPTSVFWAPLLASETCDP